jgi:hypothetical protein
MPREPKDIARDILRTLHEEAWRAVEAWSHRTQPPWVYCAACGAPEGHPETGLCDHCESNR